MMLVASVAVSIAADRIRAYAKVRKVRLLLYVGIAIEAATWIIWIGTIR